MAKKNKKFTKELTPLEKYGTTVGFLGLLGWVNLPFVVGFALIGKNNWLGEYSDILAIFFSILSIFTMFCIILSYFKKVYFGAFIFDLHTHIYRIYNNAYLDRFYRFSFVFFERWT